MTTFRRHITTPSRSQARVGDGFSTPRRYHVTASTPLPCERGLGGFSPLTTFRPIIATTPSRSQARAVGVFFFLFFFFLFISLLLMYFFFS
jgi:hypothetical protein